MTKDLLVPKRTGRISPSRKSYQIICGVALMNLVFFGPFLIYVAVVQRTHNAWVGGATPNFHEAQEFEITTPPPADEFIPTPTVESLLVPTRLPLASASTSPPRNYTERRIRAFNIFFYAAQQQMERMTWDIRLLDMIPGFWMSYQDIAIAYNKNGSAENLRRRLSYRSGNLFVYAILSYRPDRNFLMEDYTTHAELIWQPMIERYQNKTILFINKKNGTAVIERTPVWRPHTSMEYDDLLFWNELFYKRIIANYGDPFDYLPDSAQCMMAFFKHAHFVYTTNQ